MYFRVHWKVLSTPYSISYLSVEYHLTSHTYPLKECKVTPLALYLHNSVVIRNLKTLTPDSTGNTCSFVNYIHVILTFKLDLFLECPVKDALCNVH